MCHIWIKINRPDYSFIARHSFIACHREAARYAARDRIRISRSHGTMRSAPWVWQIYGNRKDNLIELRERAKFKLGLLELDVAMSRTQALSDTQ
jgi:hypothetical protein